jgi:hypothetical protein
MAEHLHPSLILREECHVNASSLPRAEPNVKWGIDRGTNPDGSKRDNDAHLTAAHESACSQI